MKAARGLVRMTWLGIQGMLTLTIMNAVLLLAAGPIKRLGPDGPVPDGN